jgi:hypothetical protein
MVDSKTLGILHGPTSMGCWVASFLNFASMIEWKLTLEDYGGMLFNNVRIFGFVNCKIAETYHPGSGPAED